MVSSLFIFLCVGLFFYWIYREEENLRKKNELWSKALKITKFFGDTEIALFRFKGKENAEYARLWVLVEFNDRHDDIYSLPSHEKYYVVDKTYSHASDKEVDEVETTVRKTLAMMPYNIDIYDAPITYERYQERVSERIDRRINEDTDDL